MPILAVYVYGLLPQISRRNGLAKKVGLEAKVMMALAMNGKMTTWDMAKKDPEVMNVERERGGAEAYHKRREKASLYSRVINGRRDGSKRYEGLADLWLVVKDGHRVSKGQEVPLYRLTLFGVLGTIHLIEEFQRLGKAEELKKVGINMSDDYIDMIAKNYASQLPRVFGVWDQLKEKIGGFVYDLKNLAEGSLGIDQKSLWLNTDEINDSTSTPLKGKSEVMNAEVRLSNDVSYWFWSNLQWWIKLKNVKMHSQRDPYREFAEIMRSCLGDTAWYTKWLNFVEEHLSQTLTEVRALESLLK